MNNLTPDIPGNWLEIINEILKKQIPKRTVWLYGSRANGTACESSDIDLVFFPPENPVEQSDEKLHSTELKLQLKMKIIFQESNLPVFVDILSWLVIPDLFKDQIKSENFITISY